MAALGLRYGDPKYQTGTRKSPPKPDDDYDNIVDLNQLNAEEEVEYLEDEEPIEDPTVEDPTILDDAARTIPISPNLAPFRLWLDQKYDACASSSIRGPQLAHKQRDDLIFLAQKRAQVATLVLQKCLGSHPLDNAFRDVDFGTDSSVHTATVSDIMHSLEEGVITYLMKLLLDPMTENQKAKLDLAVEEMFSTDGRNRSGERAQYPRVSFQRGFSSLSMISADEHVGQLFVVSIMLRTRRGRLLFEERFSDDFDRKRKERADQRKEAAAKKKKDLEDRFDSVFDDSGRKHRAAKKRAPKKKSAAPTKQSSSKRQKKNWSADNLKDMGSPSIDVPNPTIDTEPDSSRYSEAIVDWSEWADLMQKLDLKFVLDGAAQLPLLHQNILAEQLRSLLKFSKSLNQMLLQPGNIFRQGILDYQETVAESRRTTLPKICDRFVNPSCCGTIRRIKIKSGRECCSVKLNMDQFADFCENLLSFHSFLKYGGDLFQTETVRDDYQDSFCQLMATLVDGFDREANTCGWKLQKFVECCHFGKDQVIYGPPVGHNTDRGERGLKQWAKAPAATAQNRSDTIFTGQVVRNLLETEVVKKIVASRTLTPTTAAVSYDTEPVASGRTYVYHSVNGSYSVHAAVHGKKKATQSPYPKQVSDWFTSTFGSGPGKSGPDESDSASGDFRVQIYTELTIGAKGTVNQELLRAHPNYRHEGPWYDFVDIDYGEEVGIYPARCASFFQWPAGFSPEIVGLSQIEPGQVLVLVQEAKTRTKEEVELESQLYAHYTLQGTLDQKTEKRTTKPIFKCIYPETINGRVYVVDPQSHNGGIFWKEKDRKSNNKTGPVPFRIIKIKDRQSVWPASFVGHVRPGET